MLREQAQPTSNGKTSGVKSGGRPSGTAFQRVKNEEWLGKAGSWNNAFDQNIGERGWGHKASEILLKVGHSGTIRKQG